MSGVKSACATVGEWRRKLGKVLAGHILCWQEKDELRCLLLNNLHVFAVEMGIEARQTCSE